MRKIAPGFVILLLVASFPAPAEQGDRIVRFGAVYSCPTSDRVIENSEPPDLFRDTVEADSALGGFAGIEYMATDLVGIDGTVMFANHDFDSTMQVFNDGVLEFEESFSWGETSMMPVLFSVHFHVVRNDALDLYAGPTVGYVFYDDLEIFDGEVLVWNLNDDFGYGAVAGLDASVGGGWSFSATLRYLATGAELDEREQLTVFDIDIDPVMIQAGASRRW